MLLCAPPGAATDVQTPFSALGTALYILQLDSEPMLWSGASTCAYAYSLNN
jgi:hypothetical protein